jgi:hypothetical protein
MIRKFQRKGNRLCKTRRRRSRRRRRRRMNECSLSKEAAIRGSFAIAFLNTDITVSFAWGHEN